MKNTFKYILIFLLSIQLFTSANSFEEWWEKTKALELNDETFDSTVGHDHYVIVEFYTKWCKFCRALTEEYDKLVDKMKETRPDVIVSRIDAGGNEITTTKYGIYSYPIIALFLPNSNRISSIFNRNRILPEFENWIRESAPPIKIEPIKEEKKVEIKEEKKDEPEQPLNKEINEFVKNENKNKDPNNVLRTDSSEFVKQGFIDIKKKIEELEKIGKEIELRTDKIEGDYNKKVEDERKDFMESQKNVRKKISLEIDYNVITLVKFLAGFFVPLVLTITISKISGGNKKVESDFDIKKADSHFKI